MAAKKKTAVRAKTVSKTAKSTGETAVTEKPAKKAASKTAPKQKRITKKVTAAKTPDLSADSAPNATVAKKAASKKVAAKKKAKPKSAAIAGTIPTTSGGQFKTFVPYKLTKGEEYMSPEQVEHFRAILLDWKVSLMQEVDRTVGHMKSDATNFPDPNDRATQEEEFSLELRTRDRERKLIKKIDESITKLDEEDYGYCDGCGVEIGIRRLEARPTANMCIECKTLEEIREKQIA